MRFKFFWGLILLGSIVVGCQKSNRIDSDKTIDLNKFPSHVQCEIDTNLKVDATVEAPSNTMYNIYYAKEDIKEIDLLKNVFFDGANVVENINSDREYSISKDDCYAGYYGRTYYYQTEYMMNQDVAIRLLNQDSDNIFYSYPINLNRIDTVDAIAQVRREDAVELVRQKAQMLGLTLEQQPYVIAGIEGTAMESYIKENCPIERTESLGIKENWSEEDDFIYMLWNCMLDGVELYNDNWNTNYVSGIEPIGTSVIACVNKNGIIGMFTGAMYSIEREKEKDVSLKVDLDDIYDVIKNQYRNIICKRPIRTCIEK